MINTVVYLDLVILSTIFVNYLFIVTIGYFIGEKTNVVRTLFGVLISVLSLLLFIVPIKYIYNLRYFVGLLIGLVAYKKGKNKLLGITLLYLMNLGFIGSLVVFKIKSIWVLIVAAVLIVLFHAIPHFSKNIIKPSNLTYNVVINNLKLVGFLDTGNSSTYKSIPIVYLKEKYKSNIFSYIGRTIINVVSGKTTIDVYIGPMMKIGQKEFKVYYVFSKSIGEDVILNSQMEGLNDN